MKVAYESNHDQMVKVLAANIVDVRKENGRLKKAISLLYYALNTLRTEHDLVFYEMEEEDDDFLKKFDVVK